MPRVTDVFRRAHNRLLSILSRELGWSVLTSVLWDDDVEGMCKNYQRPALFFIVQDRCAHDDVRNESCRQHTRVSTAVTSMDGNQLCAVMEEGLAPALCTNRRVAIPCDRFVRVSAQFPVYLTVVVVVVHVSRDTT